MNRFTAPLNAERSIKSVKSVRPPTNLVFLFRPRTLIPLPLSLSSVAPDMPAKRDFPLYCVDKPRRMEVADAVRAFDKAQNIAGTNALKKRKASFERRPAHTPPLKRPRPQKTLKVNLYVHQEIQTPGFRRVSLAELDRWQAGEDDAHEVGMHRRRATPHRSPRVGYDRCGV